MMPMTPQPALPHLLAARFLGHPDGNVLAAPWLRAGDLGGLWLSRSAWSLAVIADAFAMAKQRPPVVALPDYLCNQSIWPLRQRAAVVFYPVRADTLAPDWAQMGELKADCLLLVHYFGQPNDCAGARLWCDVRGALLIEDAAHALGPAPGIGESGDLVLYSQHKLLAAPDGALLVACEGARWLERWLVDALRGLGWGHPPTGPWRLKRLAQAIVPEFLLARMRSADATDFTFDPPTGVMAQLPMTSPLGAALIVRADLKHAARQRTANAATLLAAIGASAPWTVLFPIRNDFPPYRLVMRCAEPATAQELFARLRHARLPVESWPDLPPETNGGTAWQLRHTLLLLPCHQSLAPDRLASAYGEILKATA